MSQRDDSSEPEEGWFLEEVGEVLDLMAKRGVCLELNCSGFDVFGRQFPNFSKYMMSPIFSFDVASSDRPFLYSPSGVRILVLML